MEVKNWVKGDLTAQSKYNFFQFGQTGGPTAVLTMNAFTNDMSRKTVISGLPIFNLWSKPVEGFPSSRGYFGGTIFKSHAFWDIQDDINKKHGTHI